MLICDLAGSYSLYTYFQQSLQKCSTANCNSDFTILFLFAFLFHLISIMFLFYLWTIFNTNFCYLPIRNFLYLFVLYNYFYVKSFVKNYQRCERIERNHLHHLINSSDVHNRFKATVSPYEKSISLILIHDSRNVKVEKILRVIGEICLFCQLFLCVSSLQRKRQFSGRSDQTFLVFQSFD